jgi:hypothetical protein
VLLAAVVVALAGSLLRAAHTPAPPERRLTRRVGQVEWAVALAALNLLFAVFVAVWLTALFGGHEFVARTAGLTYADYARQGFGQLLVVAALTLVLIGVVDGRRRLTRALLGCLCVLTLVVLASALRRLELYEEAFGFTRLRVLAHMTMLWLGALLVLVVAAGAARRESWLPRAAVAVTATFLIGFAASNPDLRIAHGNLGRSGPVDVHYIEQLSADAAAAQRHCEEATGGPLSWNLGRSRAGC